MEVGEKLHELLLPTSLRHVSSEVLVEVAIAWTVRPGRLGIVPVGSKQALVDRGTVLRDLLEVEVLEVVE